MLESWPAVDSRPVDRREAFPTATEGDTNRSAGTLVALVGPAVDPSLVKNVDDAVLAGGANVVDRAGHCRRGPQELAERIREDPHVLPCSRCFPEQNGRSAALLSIDGNVPSSSTNAFIDAARTVSARVGASSASRSTASITKRQTVLVPTRKPAASWAYVVPFRRRASVSSACRSAVSRRQRLPIRRRCSRRRPARKRRERLDTSRPHGKQAHEASDGSGDLGREPVYQRLHPSVGPIAMPDRQGGEGSVVPGGGNGVLPVCTALAAFLLAQP